MNLAYIPTLLSDNSLTKKGEKQKTIYKTFNLYFNGIDLYTYLNKYRDKEDATCLDRGRL